MSNIIVEMKFGADLYGTVTYDKNGSRISDLDYKGISYQSNREFLLYGPQKHTHYSSTGNNLSRNGKDDIDIEIFTIHEFILHGACNGQTYAMDMLHAPSNMVLKTSSEWQFIKDNKKKFYSKNIHSYLGYCKQQAAKYEIKSSRLSDAKLVIDWLDDLVAKNDKYTRISQCDISTFPIGENLSVETFSETGVEFNVCGKKFQSTVKLGYAKDIVEKFYNAYGERSRQAANDENVDFKSISHALRAAYQMKELFTEGTITFPLKNAEFIKKVKLGELKYNDIAPILEDLIDETKELRDKSDFLDNCDVVFWQDWLCEIMSKRIKDGY
jgi:hypothetical protein